MGKINTSQDPEYEGPTFHEKRIHRTHFTVPQMPWKKDDTEDDAEDEKPRKHRRSKDE
jgi:hypothetical protein